MWPSDSRCGSSWKNRRKCWPGWARVQPSRSGMAQPAADKLRLGLADLGALLAPFPGRASATTRIAVACTLTVLVTSIYGTPEAAISAYVVFFINRADR